MCGFVAMFSKKGCPVPQDAIKAMTDEIYHRGPDDAGYWMEDWGGLGFRRLAIIDLSQNGHQPMFDATGNHVIVFNGELYNYLEIRDQLKQHGVQFRSSSDTEVVLQAYRHWGKDCLERFVGMFSFIVVTLATREIFIARDPLGIKPLYVTENDDFWIFASEIKAFRHIMRFELNHDALYEQFVFRWVAGEETPFKNVKKLPPGSFWKFRQGETPQTQIYRDVTTTLEPSETRPEASCLNDIQSALWQSIHLHTRSDVGYTVQLSGGVDSSLITAVLSQDTNQHIDTFSISVDDVACDESQYQHLVSQQYATEQHEIQVNSAFFAEALQRATWHMDVPVVHLGSVLLMRLCEASAKKSKVVLTGEGADELFGGYGHYAPKKKIRKWISLKQLSDKNRALSYLCHKLILEKRLPPAINAQLVFPRVLMESFLTDLSPSLPYRQAIVDSQKDYVNQIFAHDQLCNLQSHLDRQDKMSMAASVEARVPFCNHKLFEQINPLSAHQKLKNGQTKYLLKKIAEPYLPYDLLYRPKNGLNLPFGKWLFEDALSDYLPLLTDQTVRERGFYNHTAITRALDEHRKGVRDYAKFFAVILTFEIWMRMYIDAQISGSNRHENPSHTTPHQTTAIGQNADNTQ